MLKIGMATRDFTPTQPAMIQGQMHTRIGREAKDPLTLTAMAVEGDGGSAIVISCDLAMVSDALIAKVRADLTGRIGEVASDAVIMTATHTHDSLVIEDWFYTHPGGDVMTAGQCVELIADRAVEAAVAAWKARAPSRIARAYGHAVVGHNRRACYMDGSALMYGQTNRPDFDTIEGSEDHSLDMLLVWDGDGRLSGMVLTIPCPSQIDEGLSVFSADFWHDIRLELRKRFGPQFMVVGLCGAAGDQSPHFLLCGRLEEEMRARRGVTERQEVALRVGDAVQRALECTKPQEGEAKVARSTRRLELSPIRITQPQRDWAAAQYDRCVSDKWDLSSWWPVRLKDVRDSFDQGRTWPRFPVEIHALRIGDLGIVTNPFELFLDYGLRIKARSTAAQTMVVQLACGCGLYLPSARGLRGGHYSAMPAVCSVGPEGGTELVEASLAMLAELFAQ